MRQGMCRQHAWLWVVAPLAAFVMAGCAEPPPPEVVVYAAADQDLAQPIFNDFTLATGIPVRPKFGYDPDRIAAAIVKEASAPRCDLFWNNEILSTVRLEREGLLRPPASSVAGRSSPGDWRALAPRARVLIVNTNQVAEARRPKSIQDLIDPQWYDRVGIAKPLYGPSATHAACLFQALGDEKADEFFRALKRNALILANDKQVAQAVAAAELAFGLTNSDDANRELEAGMPVAIIYPDQGEGQLGTLFIPYTVGLLKNSPHPDEGQQLLEYLLKPEVERRLDVTKPVPIRAMQVDFSAAAEHWDTAAKLLQAEFSVDD